MKLEMEELKNEVSNVDQQVSELVLVEGRGVRGGGWVGIPCIKDGDALRKF